MLLESLEFTCLAHKTTSVQGGSEAYVGLYRVLWPCHDILIKGLKEFSCSAHEDVISNGSFVGLVPTGVYPLFRHSASDLSGAALRVHIAMTTGSLPGEAPALVVIDDDADVDSQEELLQEVEEEEVEADPGPSSTSQSHAPSSEGTNPCAGDDLAASQQTGVDATEDSFPVTVTVDRAMHLSLKGEPRPLWVAGGRLVSSASYHLLEQALIDACERNKGNSLVSLVVLNVDISYFWS